MRRVLLLVCLIVSTVELDWERQRIYLLSAVGSLLLVLYGELVRRRRLQGVATATGVTAGEAVSAKPIASGSRCRDYEGDRVGYDPRSAGVQQLALKENNSG